MRTWMVEGWWAINVSWSVPSGRRSSRTSGKLWWNSSVFVVVGPFAGPSNKSYDSILVNGQFQFQFPHSSTPFWSFFGLSVSHLKAPIIRLLLLSCHHWRQVTWSSPLQVDPITNAAVRRSQEAFRIQKAAYRHANGGSSAPTLTQDAQVHLSLELNEFDLTTGSQPENPREWFMGSLILVFCVFAS